MASWNGVGQQRYWSKLTAVILQKIWVSSIINTIFCCVCFLLLLWSVLRCYLWWPLSMSSQYMLSGKKKYIHWANSKKLNIPDNIFQLFADVRNLWNLYFHPTYFHQCFLYYKELKFFLKEMLSLAKLTFSFFSFSKESWYYQLTSLREIKGIPERHQLLLHWIH